MNRKEAEDFVYKSYMKAQKYQSYGKKDAEKRRNDLTYDLLHKTSDPPCIVVTGSKGKGSVANMISLILQSEYRVGLMTSPHMSDFCERFQVDNVKITDTEFAKQMTQIQGKIEAIETSLPKEICISPMGIQAYLALKYFQDKETSFNVFECGKGAKYDDVNNIRHEYGVINSIFLEHTRELGETLEEIARDKSYVITGEQKCVYVAKQEPEVLKIILERAESKKVLIKVYGRDFSAANIRYTRQGMLFDVVLRDKTYSDIWIPLLGEHQAYNCALALAIGNDILGNIDFEKIKEKLKLLHWPGRMEIIQNHPFVLLDACINRAGCDNVIKVLKKLDIKKITLVVGIPDDKDFFGVVKAMKAVSEDIILTKSQNPHYVFTKKQQERLKEAGIETTWTDSVPDAIRVSEKKKNPIVILGTTSVVGEVKNEYL